MLLSISESRARVRNCEMRTFFRRVSDLSRLESGANAAFADLAQRTLEKTMNTTLKTLILAAAGAALIAGFAGGRRPRPTPRSAFRALDRTNDAPGPAVKLVGLWRSQSESRVDPYARIRDEYLKDSPSHNGNSY